MNRGSVRWGLTSSHVLQWNPKKEKRGDKTNIWRITEIIPNLLKTIKSQFKNSSNPKQEKKCKPYQEHIIINFLNISDNKKPSKQPKENGPLRTEQQRYGCYQIFHLKLQARTQWRNIFKVLKKTNKQPVHLKFFT